MPFLNPILDPSLTVAEAGSAQILKLGQKIAFLYKNGVHFFIIANEITLDKSTIECYVYGAMFVRVKPSGPRKYLQIVENFRDGGKKVTANLGRWDILQRPVQLDALTCGLARHRKSCAVISDNRAGKTRVGWDKEWGPALIFGRLWEIPGFPEIIGGLKDTGKHVFDIERTVFSCVFQRL